MCTLSSISLPLSLSRYIYAYIYLSLCALCNSIRVHLRDCAIEHFLDRCLRCRDSVGDTVRIWNAI